MREPWPDCQRDPGINGLLIYDANCRLCVAVKAEFDRAGIGEAGAGLRMIPYESQEAMLALGEHYRPGPPPMAYLVSPTGSVSQGLEAFLPFVSGLPGGRVIRWLLRRAPARALAERIYRVLARHRYRLFGAVRPSVRPSPPPSY